MYPQSRIGVNDQCKLCRAYKGTMRIAGRVRVDDGAGGSVEFVRWTCDTCGYTQLFDPAGPEAEPQEGEQFPR